MHLLGRVLLLMSPAALHLDQNDECKVGLAVQSVGRNAPAFPILSLPDMKGHGIFEFMYAGKYIGEPRNGFE
eukprot:CAMPEP_0174287246 /NCGR_PEP_ID=MMETSP0809-20121228/15052_1 /TAXON_ID=73025 ORGANISM="Eutreptiella gymnastica-like, Strain CCMP1594" /NCGR_SAMPLE_ID=MMETSP0809 /ASSEMBLY_ACC=CAM_ASM_000658 /LENGTH=71 /DNA_ID=CAMNT_0015383707 /DNA_START=338 /DNA_END=551 /DNA_ORIENTATION=-